ncbi:hypothetical protein PCANC_05793 [Puccinia coronata f. sp. avenae]|uniref:Uncharacterized protein n=1 Tax=Puccinia coronata f. sp. avenae TaxID=200324 RepID=A0A2N5VSX5_9BASI|nr:hypothetical protein PCANC_11374 [Puccinia coronata f. sp. avenae]PLW53081.1 hypothetical protein PCANC_05793 [Puccinia coronata f. sp. avenae]
MKVLLALLLLNNTWACEALIGSKKELSNWPLNTAWGDEAELTRGLFPDDLTDAGHFNNHPEHPSGTTSPAYASQSNHDQLDSSVWEMPESNLGFNNFGYNLDGCKSFNLDASSGMNSPSHAYHHHPFGTETHRVLESGTSDPLFWTKVLESLDAHTPQQHHSNLVPDVASNSKHHPTGLMELDAPIDYDLFNSFEPHTLNVPSNFNHNPTESMKLEAPTDSPINPFQPRIPTSSSLAPATSFGLPIPVFTKKFFQEAGESNDKHDAHSIEKILIHLELREEESPVMMDDDTNLFRFCQHFPYIRTKKNPREKTEKGMTYRQTKYFTTNRKIWLNYWKAKTNIDLDGYVKQIDLPSFRKIFPLFLFHIEVITMILPPMKMEGLDARCQWYVKFVNAINKLPDAQEEPELYQQVHSFSPKNPRSSNHHSAALWKLVPAWAKTYRPSIIIRETPGKPLQVPPGTTSFINAIFAGSITKLTQKCQSGT